DRDDAKKWALGRWPVSPEHPIAEEFKIGEIDATDKPVVRVAVTALILHEGKILLGKLKKSGHYVLPEGELEVGESNESAIRRAVKVSTGLDVGAVSVSKHAPYISTFVEKAGQHFISLVMSVQYTEGVPAPLDPMWESVDWYDAEHPPKPLIVTVQQIIALARYNANPPPPPEPLPKNPPSLVKKLAAARRKGKPVRSVTKRKR
ncbi:MAG: NUDIX domain-containing protein, partial [Tepidisphaeraceae bacterium]